MAVYDSFDRYADGTVPTVASTGQVWGQFSGPGTVQGGYYDSTEGTGASYIEVASGLSRIDTIGATFRFDTKGGTRSGNGCALCLVTWADGGIVAEGFGRRTSAHVVVTPTAVQWYVRDVEAGGEVTVVATRTISPALTFDVDHTIEVTIDHDAHTGAAVIDGTRTFTWSDSRIVQYPDETWACWEPYYTADGTAPRSRVKNVWADGVEADVPPASTTPELVGSAATRLTSAVTSASVVVPAVQDGDLIIVASSFLANSLTLTQTAGPTLTATTANQRSGITGRLFYRTATAADSGQTITIGSSAANVGQTNLWVLRNVAWVSGTDTRLNQGSGLSTITVPAHTPAAGRLPVHIIGLGRGSNAAATLTPATGMSVIAADLPSSTQRTGWVLAARLTDDTTAVGTTWTNTSDHFAVTWTLSLEPTAPAVVVETGGSTATVATSTTAAGVARRRGGSTAVVATAPVGQRVVRRTGGATATTTTATAGGGRRTGRGASTAATGTTPTGAGRRTIAGGSTTSVATTVSGTGRRTARGGSGTSVATFSTALGRKVRAAAAVATVTVTAVGGGSGVVPGSGGATAGVATSTSGVGRALHRGGATAPTGTGTSGSGRKRTTRAAVAPVVVVATGAGTAVRPAAAAGGSVASTTVTATGGGVRRARAGAVETVTVETTAAGRARHSSGGTAVVHVAALGADGPVVPPRPIGRLTLTLTLPVRTLAVEVS